MKKYLTIQEAASYLGVSEETIKRYSKKGLPTHRLERAVRFLAEDLDAFISREREIVLTPGVNAVIKTKTVESAIGSGCWRVVLTFYNPDKGREGFVGFGSDNKIFKYYVWVTEEYLEDFKKLSSTVFNAEKFALDFIKKRFDETKNDDGDRALESIKESQVYCRKGRCVLGEEWKMKKFIIELKDGRKFEVEKPSRHRLLKWLNTGAAGFLPIRSNEFIRFTNENILKITEIDD